MNPSRARPATTPTIEAAYNVAAAPSPSGTAAGTARQTKPRRRASPFSLRLSEAEKARLVAEAKGTPLGTYIKAKVMGAPLRARRSGPAVEDRKALAQALALLGQSRFASNLNQLAHAIHLGILPLTPETEAELREACTAVVDMRRLLIGALGLKTGSAP